MNFMQARDVDYHCDDVNSRGYQELAANTAFWQPIVKATGYRITNRRGASFRGVSREANEPGISRNFPMCNSTSGVRLPEPPRNDGKALARLHRSVQRAVLVIYLAHYRDTKRTGRRHSQQGTRAGS